MWHVGDFAFERLLPGVRKHIAQTSCCSYQPSQTTELLTLLLHTAACRLPFLRHTPLKELYKLSKHLTASRFNRGDVLISQVRLLTWTDWLPCNRWAQEAGGQIHASALHMQAATIP